MRIGGTVLSALLVLGACSSEAAPREPTTSAASPTPSTTPSAVVPTMSKQATEDSPEGAAAFVKHYIDVFNYAAATGDVDELTRLSSPDCKGCQNYIKLYRDTYAAGGYFKGGGWKVGPLDVKHRPKRSQVETRVSYEQSRYQLTDEDPVSAGAAGHARIKFTVSSQARQKSITQLKLADQS